MEKILVTVSKHKVKLTHRMDGSTEETNEGKISEYQDHSYQADNSSSSRRKAIEEVVQKIAGLNAYALSSARDLKKPYYTKLIITKI